MASEFSAVTAAEGNAKPCKSSTSNENNDACNDEYNFNIQKNYIEDSTVTSSFERKYVHAFYSKYASQFSATRRTPWPLLTRFLAEFSESSIILDAGCGNGRLLGSRVAVGLDYSSELLEEAKRRGSAGLGLVQGDVARLPFKECVFDGVMCVAVLHHLKGWERQVRAVAELRRVLKRGGRGAVYVWGRKAAVAGKFVPLIEGVGEGAGVCEYLVGWRGEAQQRYCALFTVDGLVQVCTAAGFTVISSGEDGTNVYAIVER